MAGLQNLTVQEAQNTQLGQLGSGHLDAGEAAASIPSGAVIIAITILEDSTTFTALTQESADYFGIGTSTYSANSLADSDIFPAGVTVYGRWTALTINAGSCIFYLGA